MTRKIVSIFLALFILCSLAACGAKKGASHTDLPVEVPSTDSDLPSTVPEEAQPVTEPINIMVLNGTTGFGMAKLMCDTAAGERDMGYKKYNFSVETDASNITAALINGSVDIAALPTNAASVVYNKTQGGVQLLALNTLGVLYLVADESENISSLSDLEGKTVYAPAQNPSFVMQYICQNAGVNVTIDNSYAQPADLRTALAAGEVSLAVLPEPMVTIACTANDKLSVVLDLTEEWGKISSSQLVQGCLVVRRDFADSHPGALSAFLKEYEASIAYLSEDSADAARMIAEAGIFAQAAVAEKAIPRCNVCFIEGLDMITPMDGFLEAMFSVAPNSIGGAVPGDDFYYMG